MIKSRVQISPQFFFNVMSHSSLIKSRATIWLQMSYLYSVPSNVLKVRPVMLQTASGGGSGRQENLEAVKRENVVGIESFTSYLLHFLPLIISISPVNSGTKPFGQATGGQLGNGGGGSMHRISGHFSSVFAISF